MMNRDKYMIREYYSISFVVAVLTMIAFVDEQSAVDDDVDDDDCRNVDDDVCAFRTSS